MKQQVVYIHGGDSFSDYQNYLAYLRTCPVWELPTTTPVGSWKKSLAADLGDGYEVFMPAMPNRTNARYAEWRIWFERYFEYFHDGVILIGGSLGGMFLAKYLSEQTTPMQISALFLLAAPGGEYGVPDTSGDCQDFTFSQKQAAMLTQNIPKVEIWHSVDDLVVPVAEAQWYKTHVPGAKVTIFKDKNHFLVPQLPEIIAAITEN